MSGAITPLPNTPLWCGARLKHRDNFTFTLTSKGKSSIRDDSDDNEYYIQEIFILRKDLLRGNDLLQSCFN
jgi:hypothetical protein